MFTKPLLAAASAASLLFSATAAQSAAYSYDGEITVGDVTAGSYSFGAVGAPISAMLTITATTGEALPIGFSTGGLVELSLDSADFDLLLSTSPQGANDGFSTSLEVNSTRMRLATSEGDGFDWPGIMAGSSLRSIFTVTFGTPLGGAPTTYDELIAALAAPGATAEFVTSGDFLTLDGSSFDSLTAEFAPTAVPGPAAALSLLGGLGLLAGMRRRG